MEWENQIRGGVKALRLYKQKTKKSTILLEEDQVLLQISAIKIAPNAGKHTIRIPLPAPYTATSEVCLFVKDLQRGIRVDHQDSIIHWKKVLDEAGVTSITTVMPLRQVKAEYKMYEARRKLCNAYDVFLADEGILRLLPTLLGKHFIVQKKFPVGVSMNPKKVAKNIRKALSSTYLRVYSQGDSSLVQVGHMGQSDHDLVENVLAAMKMLELKFPGGLRNIRNVQLKLKLSPAIHIYTNDIDPNRVPVPRPPKRPSDNRGPIIGELSTTRAECDVMVTPEGDVTVLQKRPASDDEEDSGWEEEKEFDRSHHLNQHKRQKGGVKKKQKRDQSEESAVDDGAHAQNSSDEEEAVMEAQEKSFLDRLGTEKNENLQPQEKIKKKKKSKGEKRKREVMEDDTSSAAAPKKKVKSKKTLKVSESRAGSVEVRNTPSTGEYLALEPSETKKEKKRKGEKQRDEGKDTAKGETALASGPKTKAAKSKKASKMSQSAAENMKMVDTPSVGNCVVFKLDGATKKKKSKGEKQKGGR